MFRVPQMLSKGTGFERSTARAGAHEGQSPSHHRSGGARLRRVSRFPIVPKVTVRLARCNEERPVLHLHWYRPALTDRELLRTVRAENFISPPCRPEQSLSFCTKRVQSVVFLNMDCPPAFRHHYISACGVSGIPPAFPLRSVGRSNYQTAANIAPARRSRSFGRPASIYRRV